METNDKDKIRSLNSKINSLTKENNKLKKRLSSEFTNEKQIQLLNERLIKANSIINDIIHGSIRNDLDDKAQSNVS